MLYYVTFMVNSEYMDAIIKMNDHFCPLIAIDKLYDFFIEYTDDDHRIFIVYHSPMKIPITVETEPNYYLI
jgi:hypothetical protein